MRGGDHPRDALGQPGAFRRLARRSARDSYRAAHVGDALIRTGDQRPYPLHDRALARSVTAHCAALHLSTACLRW